MPRAVGATVTLVAALCALLAVDAPVDAPGAAPAHDDVFSPFVRGERVLLVEDDATSPLAIRTHDELEAIGFFVVTRDHTDVPDVVSTARALGAVAAVEVHATRLDLWADLLAHEGVVAHASLMSTGDDVDVVAVRAAELVRARVLPTRADHPTAVVLAPDVDASADVAAHAQRDVRWRAGIGAGGFWAIGGVPPALHVDADVRAVLYETLTLGLRLSAPTLPAGIDSESALAHADISMGMLGMFGGWTIPIVDGVDATLGAGVSALWLHGVGTSVDGIPARSGDLIVTAPFAEADLAWVPVAPLTLFSKIEAGALLPSIVLGVRGDEINVGPAYGALLIGVGVAL